MGTGIEILIGVLIAVVGAVVVWKVYVEFFAHVIGDLIGRPPWSKTVRTIQVALLPVAYYTGDSFSPAKRRDARKITHLNGWGNTLFEG